MPTLAEEARAAVAVARRLVPVAVAAAAAVALYAGLERAAAHLPGPPGYAVATVSPGHALATLRTPWLLAPEVIPALPVDGARTARATLLAHRSGRYKFTFGAGARGNLFIDGKPVLGARDQRVHDVEVELERGLHAILVDLTKGDSEGTVMLAMRPPLSPGGTRLLGPGDVVALTPEEVEARLRGHATLVVTLLPFLPALGTLAFALAAVALAGASGRRRARAHLSSLWSEPAVRSVATAAVLLLLAAPVLAPLFAPGYYECHEEESFMVRLNQFAAATSEGVPMGRWFADPVFGRGYPFLCLYAPLLYLLAWPLLAVGLSSLATMKILSAAMVLVAEIATFKLVRRRASREAAVLGASLLLYAPYFQYDLYVRGALAETLGFATFPLALWALDAALDRRPAGSPRAYLEVALLALALGLLGSSHNITGYFAVWFIALWIVLRLALRDAGWDGIVRITVAGALGFLLTVFYAVPAIFDKQRVHIELITSGFYNYAGHFHGLAQVLRGSPGRYDITLGVTADLVVALAIFATLRGRIAGPLRNRPHLVLTLIGLGGTWLATGLITPRPLGAWFFATVPLAKFVEFPWRLFLFAACCSALTAAGAIDGLLAPGRRRKLVAGAATALVVLSALPFVGPPSPLLRRHTHEERFLHELSVDYVTSMNEYLPLTVVTQKRRFADVARLSNPKSGSLGSLERAPGRYRATVIAEAPSIVEFNAHWFPGWRAFVDDVEVLIGPGTNTFDSGGLIRVAVPPGTHEATLRYGRTPLRLVCDLISLAALLVVAALLGLALRQRRDRDRTAV